MARGLKITEVYSRNADVVLFQGDCLDLLKQIPDGAAKLVVTSPPYNLGKCYEKRVPLVAYLEGQSKVIAECVRILSDKGSICWQVGTYAQRGRIVPLDILFYPEFEKHGMRMRNRIIWHSKSGLNCRNRFSGRHETIMWFTKTDDYVFNLDPVRVPQKHPGKKHFKGPKAGRYSCNPLGKNPGDVWYMPKVGHNHPEKTEHPCQYPVALAERLVLALTDPGDLVVDPFLGSATTAVAALLHNRRCAGAEKIPRYAAIGKKRLKQLQNRNLRYQALKNATMKKTKMAA